MYTQQNTEVEALSAFGLSRKDLSAIQWIQLIIQKAPPEPIEFAFGLIAFCRGIWIMMPWWDAFNSSTVYKIHLSLIPEEFVWGMIEAFVGIHCIIALYKDWSLTRFWSLVALTSMWLGYVPAFLFSDWRSAGWVGMLTFSICCGWAALRMKSILRLKHLFGE